MAVSGETGRKKKHSASLRFGCTRQSPPRYPAGMPETSFAILFLKARDGDEGAREELYRLALSMASNSARKRLQDRDRALLQSQDIRQSVVLRLHRQLPDLHFEEPRELGAWLAEATRRILKEKRRNARREKRDVQREVRLPTEGLPDHAALSVRRALTRIAVEQALSDLPEETALVVRLRAFDGHSFAEVSERLGLTGPDAARKRYARALVKLGDLLGPDSGF